MTMTSEGPGRRCQRRLKTRLFYDRFIGRKCGQLVDLSIDSLWSTQELSHKNVQNLTSDSSSTQSVEEESEVRFSSSRGNLRGVSFLYWRRVDMTLLHYSSTSRGVM